MDASPAPCRRPADELRTHLFISASHSLKAFLCRALANLSEFEDAAGTAVEFAPMKTKVLVGLAAIAVSAALAPAARAGVSVDFHFGFPFPPIPVPRVVVA